MNGEFITNVSRVNAAFKSGVFRAEVAGTSTRRRNSFFLDRKRVGKTFSVYTFRYREIHFASSSRGKFEGVLLQRRCLKQQQYQLPLPTLIMLHNELFVLHRAGIR
jgi:hypothetical protein